MTSHEEIIWCDGCGVEITWGPVVIAARSYCCQDCAQGYACACGERMELEEDMRDSPETSIPSYSGHPD